MNEVCHEVSEVEARLIRHVQVYGVATQANLGKRLPGGILLVACPSTRKELQ